MPYIKQEERKLLATGIKPFTVGQLNYMITLDVLECRNHVTSLESLEGIVVRRVMDFLHPILSYANFNEIMGALTCVAAEFERRTRASTERDHQILRVLGKVARDFYATYVAPYEKQKIEENGDLY